MVITVNLYVHGNDAELIGKIAQLIDSKLSPVTAALKQLATDEEKVMATLQDIVDEVAQERDVVTSAVTLIQSLADKVAALTPDQAAIDQLAADIKASSDQLAAAVAANTPAAP